MADPLPGPTFDQSVYFCITGLLFAFATIIAITRAVIRVHMFHNVFADDYFFFFAFLTLVCSNGFFYYITPLVYLNLRLESGTETEDLYLENLEIITRFFYPAEVLAWTTIFSVKLSFLLYFRTLIKRLHALMVLWWCVLFFCIPVACMVVIAPLVTCADFDLPTLQCEKGFHLYWSTTADIVTDISIISIPIFLLRKVHFDARQKLSIGFVLCLSVVMIAIGLVRIISAQYLPTGSVNLTWPNFWVQVESSVSVIAVSMTAFRTLFVITSGPKRTPPEHMTRAPSTQWLRKKINGIELPKVDIGATMTGIRTMIRENGKTETTSFGPTELPLSPVHHRSERESV